MYATSKILGKLTICILKVIETTILCVAVIVGVFVFLFSLAHHKTVQ